MVLGFARRGGGGMDTLVLDAVSIPLTTALYLNTGSLLLEVVRISGWNHCSIYHCLGISRPIDLLRTYE